MSFSNKSKMQAIFDKRFPGGYGPYSYEENLDPEKLGTYSSYCLDLLSSPFINANKLKKENRFEILMDLHNFDHKKLQEKYSIPKKCLQYHKEGLDVMKKKFKTHAQPDVDYQLKIDGTFEELKNSMDEF